MPILVTVLAFGTLAVGLIAKAAGVYWGTPAQPLLVFYRPELSAWALLGIAVLAASLYAGIRLFRAEIGAFRFGSALFALTLISRLALNMVREGPHGWISDFVVAKTGEGRNEYLPELVHLRDGVGPFLEHYVSLVPTLTVHTAGHPPGLLVAMHWLGIDTAEGAAALVIGVGALTTPALYALGRELFEEPVARAAALLFVFVPTSLLYGATTADALYATLGVLAAALLLSQRRVAVVAGALALAIASFFSYALLGVGAWAAIVRWRRHGWRSALEMALVCGAFLVGFYLALGLVFDFDVLAAIRATDERYREGIASVRPYLFYFFGSPAAFLLMLGPVAWFAARSLGRGEATALALAAVIGVSVVAGYTKAETERIWLFLVPFACLAAARALPSAWLRPLLWALAGQALAIEILLFTRW